MGEQITVTPRQCSFSGDAIVQTSYADDGIVRGLGFTFEKNISIDTGATAYVLLDYSTYAPAPGQYGLVYIFPPFFQTTIGAVTVNVYRGSDYTGGTPIIAYNPNTLATKTQSGTTITIGATGSTKGTKVLEYLVGGASQGNQSASGSSTGLEFFIRPNTTKTLVEIVNGAGSAIIFHYSQLLYEI